MYEWMKNMWDKDIDIYIHTMEYYSAIKKNENLHEHVKEYKEKSGLN